MERKIVYPLTECKFNDTILVNLSSYCADEFVVKIISDTSPDLQMMYYEYTHAQKVAGEFESVAPGSFVYEYGQNLRVEIYSNNELSFCDVFGSILDYKADNLGFSYNLFVEDNHGYIPDYNDIVMSIHTWRTGG